MSPRTIGLSNPLYAWLLSHTDRNASTEAIRAVTKFIHADARVDSVLVPIGDGLMVARRT